MVTLRIPEPHTSPSASSNLNSDQGISFALSPIQLAAVLSEATIESGAQFPQRMWGAAKLIGGALELIGAAGLLLAPEPTAVTKVAGAALGAHGIDTSAAAIRQITSGRETVTQTADVAKSIASNFGADPKSAELIGLGTDLALPMLAGGLGILRVVAVRRGAINLAAEEAAGGHTILRHVGQTEQQLRNRLARQLRIPAASTFKTLAQAEHHVGAAVRAHRGAIEAWAKTSAVGGRPLTVTYQANGFVGEGVVRSTGRLQQMSQLVVVLRRVQHQNRVYFVLTAYPIP